MQPRAWLLIILCGLLLNSCDEPEQPAGSRFIEPDSILVMADFNGTHWYPNDSSVHSLTFELDHQNNRLNLVAWSTNAFTKLGPGLYITIDSLHGEGTYPVSLQGPARVSFDTRGDGKPGGLSGHGVDGVITINTFDTLVSNNVPRIHAYFDLRVASSQLASDTTTITGRFEAVWLR